jgi:hypothetical protein|tara:strand:+ start:57 stop:275 length:219 start_codon:yes stop_codon:yes gene_type:complete
MYDTDKQDIKSVIFSGCSVEKAGVSICNLTNHIAFRLGSKSGSYQVWSDRHRVYDLFRNLDDAVNKFLELAK